MQEFKKGLIEAISGVVGAIFYSAFLASLSQDKSIPHDYFWVFPLVSLAGTVSTIFVFKTAGFLFNLGVIIGAWLFKDAMDTSTFLLYFGVPVVILVLRIYYLIKKATG